jgi:hypothetical protein
VLRCNEAYDATVSERPHLVAERGGSGLLLVTPLRAHWSDDRACTLAEVAGLSHDYLGGFAASSDGALLLVSTVAPDAVSRVYASLDGGRSWSVRSENRPSEVFTALAIAPGDAQRVYASGTRVDREAQTLTPLWARSSDGGASFEVLDVPSERTVLAVFPHDPSLVLASQRAETVELGHRLLRSEDGGESFVVVHEGLSSVSAFASTPDGGTVWVGAGKDGGLFRSADAGITFARVHEEFSEVSCLHRRQGKLWLCGNQLPNVDGVWSSADEGQTFEPVLTFPEVTAPLSCGEADAICAAPWRDWELELVPRDGDAGVSADAGPQVPAADSGARGSDAAAPAEDGGTPRGKEGGGGCSAVAPRVQSIAVAPMVLALLALARVRRRSRTRPMG